MEKYLDSLKGVIGSKSIEFRNRIAALAKSKHTQKLLNLAKQSPIAARLVKFFEKIGWDQPSDALEDKVTSDIPILGDDSLDLCEIVGPFALNNQPDLQLNTTPLDPKKYLKKMLDENQIAEIDSLQETVNGMLRFISISGGKLPQQNSLEQLIFLNKLNNLHQKITALDDDSQARITLAESELFKLNSSTESTKSSTELIKFFLNRVIQVEQVKLNNPKQAINLASLENKWEKEREQSEESKKKIQWLERRLSIAENEYKLFTINKNKSVKSLKDIEQWFEDNNINDPAKLELLKSRFREVENESKLSDLEFLQQKFPFVQDLEKLQIQVRITEPFCTILILGNDDYDRLSGSPTSAGLHLMSTSIILVKSKYRNPKLIEHEYQHSVNNLLRLKQEAVPHRYTNDQSIKSIERWEIYQAKDELIAHLWNTNQLKSKNLLDGGSQDYYNYRKSSLNRIGESENQNLKDITGYQSKVNIMANSLYGSLKALKKIYPSKNKGEIIQICASIFRDTNPENFANLAQIMSLKANQK